MQHDDRARRLRFATARQRTGAVLLAVVLVTLVVAARSGRYDRTVGHLAQRLEAGIGHVTGFVRRHLGG